MTPARTMLLSISIISGCSSLKNDCMSLAPEAEWKVVPEPRVSIVQKFRHLEVGSNQVWFKEGNGKYGLCIACDDNGQRASSFEVESGEATVRTCGPY
jgi:hypothetical protein